MLTRTSARQTKTEIIVRPGTMIIQKIVDCLIPRNLKPTIFVALVNELVIIFDISEYVVVNVRKIPFTKSLT